MRVKLVLNWHLFAPIPRYFSLESGGIHFCLIHISKTVLQKFYFLFISDYFILKMNGGGPNEKRRSECAALPKGWIREEVMRKGGLSAGKFDVYYYPPVGKKVRSKPELIKVLGDTFDLSCFDYSSGTMHSTLIKVTNQKLRMISSSLAKRNPDNCSGKKD